MTMCSVISFMRTVAAALVGFGLAVVLPHSLSARNGGVGAQPLGEEAELRIPVLLQAPICFLGKRR